MNTSKPSYLYLSQNDWDDRIREADRIASACALCPRRCGVNRLKGEKGFCNAPGELVISSIFRHHGEEPPISGTGGSGTVFFSYCTLKCVFCQNYQISWEAEGRPYSTEGLAEELIGLQRQGCHNINLVTPTHFLPWILRSLKKSVADGLSIPIVHNNGGYELPESLALLRGIVDIYLPDMKYGGNAEARRYSGAADYVEINQRAIVEMFRQAGRLQTNERGIARKGLCIRHLVLPDGRAGSGKILDFILGRFDPEDMTVSLMAQYRPIYRAHEFGEIARPLRRDEYDDVKKRFAQAGINGFYQELSRLDSGFRIDFKKRKHEPLIGK